MHPVTVRPFSKCPNARAATRIHPADKVLGQMAIMSETWIFVLETLLGHAFALSAVFLRAERK
jgi:hypothetical protein